MEDSTEEVLLEFIEKADKLMARRFTKFMGENGQNFSLSFSPEQPLTLQYTMPDEEMVEAYIVTFRMFIMQHEKISIVGQQPGMRLLAIGDSSLSDTFRDKVLQNIQEMNNYLEKFPSLQVQLNGHLPNRREVMEKFIYGDIAHINNKEKRDDYKRWRRVPPALNLYRQEFHGIIYELLFGIRIIQLLCREELGLPAIEPIKEPGSKLLPG